MKPTTDVNRLADPDPNAHIYTGKTVTLWIPLDDVPRDTTLEFVSGSHKWNKFYRPQRFDRSALNADDGLEEIPDINGNKQDYEIIGWAVKPGDAIAFDYRTIHGAPAFEGAAMADIEEMRPNFRLIIHIVLSRNIMR